MRGRDLRLQSRGVEAVMLGGRGVGVAVPARGVARLAAGVADEVDGDLIRLDQAGLAADLGSHVGERHALLHRQPLDRLAGELNRLRAAAVEAELAAEKQHDVLGDHAVAELSAPFDLDRLGHPQPDLAGR